MIKANFVFKLSQPITAHDGKVKDFDKLTLYRPAVKQIKYASQIKQAFMSGVMNMDIVKNQKKSNKSNKPASAMKDGDVLTLLMGTDCDIAGVFEDFEQLLYCGICKIDDRIEFTDFHYEQMCLEDVENLLDKYMMHFLVSSLGLGK